MESKSVYEYRMIHLCQQSSECYVLLSQFAGPGSMLALAEATPVTSERRDAMAPLMPSPDLVRSWYLFQGGSSGT